MNEDYKLQELRIELNQYCDRHNLPEEDPNELLKTNREQEKWLVSYIERWDTASEEYHARP